MKKNDNGYGVILLFILIVVPLIAFVGWYVWQNRTTRTANDTQAMVDDPTTLETKSIDQYTGWETYCDEVSRLCFRYPSDWTITSSRVADMAFADVRNSSNTLSISYNSGYNKDGGVGDFFPISLDKVDSLSGLSILGGVRKWTGYDPSYDVINESILRTYPIELNKTSHFIDNPRFSHKETIYILRTRVIGKTFGSQEEASQWFATTDAINSLLVLKSLTEQ